MVANLSPRPPEFSVSRKADLCHRLEQFFQFRSWQSITLFLTAVFVFRLIFGLRYFWDEDARQVYLIGLKFYTTSTWPYFGPDVVYTTSQIPGALQGILVGAPFFLLPIPEAPFVLLNLLSVAGLALLAWYVCRRMPGLPRWFAWLWVFIVPWGLFVSTRTVNIDYLLAGAVIFFVGLFESIPSIRGGVVRPWLGGGMVGFGLLWIFQLHMSWPILVPLVGYAAVSGARADSRVFAQTAIGFLAGAALPALLLLPTFVVYGIFGGLGGTEQNVAYQFRNPVELLLTILARFLSFASYELPYWMGGTTVDRIALLKRHFWVIPFAVLLLLVGHLQPIVLLVEGFRRKVQREWPAVRNLTLATVVLLFLGFLFSVKGPSSHTFYVMFPLAMLYSMYCWYPYLQKRFWRRFSAVVLISGFMVSLAFLFEHHPQQSFAVDRDNAARAIQQRDYRLMGERRAAEWGCCY